MKLTKEQIEYAKCATITAVVNYITSTQNVESEVALQHFSRTKTFAALQNNKGKLYLESNEYVLDMLSSELKDDWNNWLKV
jgi:hypothetical protein